MTSSRGGSTGDETVSVGPSEDNFELAIVVTAPGGSFSKRLPRSGTVRIGRADECEIPIADNAISRVHAIIHAGRVLSIEDAGSRNGTVVLGARATHGERLPLPLGAVIQIGHAVLVLVREPATVSAAPPRARDGEAGASAIVTASDAMRELFETIGVIAQTPLSVLVLGETGAGKDVVAREIHRKSPRAAGPFVALNCAALAESIVESELFGYAQGAFTGATQARAGLFETADHGTLFLDEIGDLSPAAQAKLLRVIETGEVLPLGGRRIKKVDVRLVAATHRDVPSLVRSGGFREDLYFRLNGVTVRVPPLRERRADVAPLAASFAEAVAARLGRTPPQLDPSAISAMEAYAWPGNVRELRNVVERGVALARGGPVLRASHFQLEGLRADSTGPRPVHSRDNIDAALTEPPPSGDPPKERARIEAALARASGNQTVAAKLLGVSRRTLIRRIEDYGIGRPRKG